MKKSSTGLLRIINARELENLTNDVKETIVSGIFSLNGRTFTAAELWHIQRNGKNRPQRRFLYI